MSYKKCRNTIKLIVIFYHYYCYCDYYDYYNYCDYCDYYNYCDYCDYYGFDYYDYKYVLWSI